MWIFPLPHYLCHYAPYLFWNGSKINPLSFSSPTHFFLLIFLNHSNRKIANRCKEVMPQRGERPVMRSRRAWHPHLLNTTGPWDCREHVTPSPRVCPWEKLRSKPSQHQAPSSRLCMFLCCEFHKKGRTSLLRRPLKSLIVP